MIPWERLGTAEMPGGGGALHLMKRGAEFSIRAGSIELMNSRRSGSEVALASLSCERIRDRRQPSLLIGGLGMGFTLRAALERLGDQAAVEVAELVPAVVAWARGPMGELFGNCLDDARVSIREADVRGVILSRRAAYDAILLDVDNGPQGLTRSANDRLYDAEGLGAARAALRPGGILSVWSSGPDANFSRRLRRAGFGVEEIGSKSGGARHVIWIATKAAARSG